MQRALQLVGLQRLDGPLLQLLRRSPGIANEWIGGQRRSAVRRLCPRSMLALLCLRGLVAVPACGQQECHNFDQLYVGTERRSSASRLVCVQF